MVVVIEEIFCSWPCLPSIVLCADEWPGCVSNVVCLHMLHFLGWCVHGVFDYLSCIGRNYHHILQYCDFWPQKISFLQRGGILLLPLWDNGRKTQLSWKDGHSCQHACLGQSYIRCWNLGSDLHLFDEAMRLLRTAAGKLYVILEEIH